MAGLRELVPHHAAWLSAHPLRDEAWLRRMTADGFDVHHLDGDHQNNDPANLLLIEHTDHMALHGGRMNGRLERRSTKGRKHKGKTIKLPDGRALQVFPGETPRRLLAMFGCDPTNPRFRLARSAA